MRPFLWLALTVAMIINMANSLVFDGATESTVGILSGAAAIAAIIALVRTREGRT
ncbi:hypothetical protein [Streptomyces spectabilis]|uniref:hypothetical protein n=1 Tax=Streptomyces spectabilis TaxID=68270 RepID=UPI0013776E02|nr:hypothetical protein [Streptomyces spectabilis]